MDVKQRCAEKALEYITEGSIIGLGGGSTIKHLITLLKENKMYVKVVTPSWETKQTCNDAGLEVVSITDVTKIDTAFDGCDQVDQQLHALKSGGGIHTREKLVAGLSEEYILLVDETKVVPVLTYDHPVVLEVLPQALRFVTREVESFSVRSSHVRHSSEQDGPVRTENGNLLLDVYMEKVRDSADLERRFKGVTGVVDTSLFTSVVTKVLVAGETGVQEMNKGGDVR
ncbi:ribose 5-phosphate isomerase A [Halobacillus halophilus]|uniref:ribose 5-phosphate isomerase A n=1 Tax=Halobacillus halophilus TaxID=1570 RepID=UPI00136EBBB8|nr:ribose 5-phosphate isomerase A [Halobacillus halophilus]MYL31496.1 ribose 5-phosphate isomerase A [Halobacillus halophilus]